MSSSADADWIQRDQEFQLKMADIKARDDDRKRTARTERVVAVSWAVGIVLSLAIIASLIYFWQADSGARGREVEQSCIAAGGTWTTFNGGAKVCVHLGKVPQ